eukprot:CAMPEP_0182872758 /NCGR_PEP_ID=MMETSP0034_2-20130328/11909_1 /TAXON_ID=156128 /ORGANISM="Nephroselmis pyriformis, Strain CCMP717" /LENGTH=362 /DNA_ID=CAMNT_0025005365 /DNA_START=15 /DNA_END=1100 /DNA_ORIENTATION=+
MSTSAAGQRRPASRGSAMCRLFPSKLNFSEPALEHDFCMEWNTANRTWDMLWSCFAVALLVMFAYGSSSSFTVMGTNIAYVWIILTRALPILFILLTRNATKETASYGYMRPYLMKYFRVGRALTYVIVYGFDTRSTWTTSADMLRFFSLDVFFSSLTMSVNLPMMVEDNSVYNFWSSLVVVVTCCLKGTYCDNLQYLAGVPGEDGAKCAMLQGVINTAQSRLLFFLSILAPLPIHPIRMDHCRHMIAQANVVWCWFVGVVLFQLELKARKQFAAKRREGKLVGDLMQRPVQNLFGLVGSVVVVFLGFAAHGAMTLPAWRPAGVGARRFVIVILPSPLGPPLGCESGSRPASPRAEEAADRR